MGGLFRLLGIFYVRSLTTDLFGCIIATPMRPGKPAVVCEEECEVAAETSVLLVLGTAAAAALVMCLQPGSAFAFA